MTWNVAYHSKAVENFVLELPQGLLARYLRLTDMMLEFGANLGMPHTRALGDGLFELRVKGREGIALHPAGTTDCHVARFYQEIG